MSSAGNGRGAAAVQRLLLAAAVTSKQDQHASHIGQNEVHHHLPTEPSAGQQLSGNTLQLAYTVSLADNGTVQPASRGRPGKAPGKGRTAAKATPPPVSLPPSTIYITTTPPSVAKKSVASLPQHISCEAISALLPTEPLPPEAAKPVATKSKGGKAAKMLLAFRPPSQHLLNSITPVTVNREVTGGGSVPLPLAAIPNGQHIGFPEGHCKAEVVTSSVKELRTKGSSFLRTHASKHGITNASRKLTSVVVQELVQHYTMEHKVNMKKDDVVLPTSTPGGVTRTLASPVGVGQRPMESKPNTVIKVMPPPAKVARISSPPRMANSVRLPEGLTLGPSQQLTIVPSTTATKVSPVVTSIMQQALPPGLPQHPLPPATLFQPKVQMPLKPAVLLPTTPLPVTAITPPKSTSSSIVVDAALKSMAKPPPPQQHQALTPISTSTPPQLTNLVIIPVGPALGSQSHTIQQHQQQASTSRINGTSPDSKGVCQAGILAKSRSELAACGTSLLRPEAAAHKVPNASRKMKDQVIEELWQHYLTSHTQDLALGKVVTPRPSPAATTKRRTQPVRKNQSSKTNGVVAVGGGGSGSGQTPSSTSPETSTTAPGAASGWVGSVVDDEDNT